MVQGLAAIFSRVMRRWLPDAFVIAVILTLVVFAAGVAAESQSPLAMVTYWGDGIWSLLGFSMQMVLILVTGFVVAESPLVRRALRRLASIPNTAPQAVVLVTLIGGILYWLNWGLGLIGSALIAREVARSVRSVDYPLLVASAYSGMAVWHAGLSGSIPLKIANPGGDQVDALLNGVAVPVSETIFSLPVLAIVGLTLATAPFVNVLMLPDESKRRPPPEDPDVPDPARERATATTPASRLEQSPLISLALAALGAAYLVRHFASGGSLGLDTINLAFIVAGLVLHLRPASYLASLSRAVGTCAGIVLQFPLYAGIMGMMVASGLAESMSEFFVRIASDVTLPLFTFLSAGIVNVFVPSGGGQWAVQAPVMLPAADALGVPAAQTAMAVAFGDAWTNLIQPFWALPLLAVAGLGVRDIMGYCTVMLLWVGLVFGVGVMLLGLTLR